MSYLAASEEREGNIVWSVARKLLCRAKEAAVEDVFCASNHAGDYEPLLNSAEFFDKLPDLYSEYITDDDMNTTSFADVGNMFELDFVPIISEKYEYASPLEVLDEVMSNARQRYNDLQYAAETASRLTGTALSLPCFDDVINEVKDE